LSGIAKEDIRAGTLVGIDRDGRLVPLETKTQRAFRLAQELVIAQQVERGESGIAGKVKRTAKAPRAAKGAKKGKK